jgi:hypothetical protein
MDFDGPVIPLYKKKHVTFAAGGRKFSIPDKIILKLIQDKSLKSFAVTDEESKNTLIISFEPVFRTFQFKPLILGIEEFRLPKNYVIDGILEPYFDKDFKPAENVNDWTLKRINIAKQDRESLKKKYGAGKSLDELREMDRLTKRREYLQEKFGKRKSLEELEELEKREQYKEILEKKFGTGKSIQELVELERQEIKKNKLIEKYGYRDSLQELEKIADEHRDLEEKYGRGKTYEELKATSAHHAVLEGKYGQGKTYNELAAIEWFDN